MSRGSPSFLALVWRDKRHAKSWTKFCNPLSMGAKYPKGWDAWDLKMLMHIPSGPGDWFAPAEPGLLVPGQAESLRADVRFWINPKPSHSLTQTNNALFLNTSTALQPQIAFLSCRQRVSSK